MRDTALAIFSDFLSGNSLPAATSIEYGKCMSNSGDTVSRSSMPFRNLRSLSISWSALVPSPYNPHRKGPRDNAYSKRMNGKGLRLNIEAHGILSTYPLYLFRHDQFVSVFIFRAPVSVDIGIQNHRVIH